MIILKAAPPFRKEWAEVDRIIRSNLPSDMRKAWAVKGYTGITQYAIETFNMHAMYRDSNYCMTFEFLEEDYFLFKLKWL
jgi:hypothetical protein